MFETSNFYPGSAIVERVYGLLGAPSEALGRFDRLIPWLLPELLDGCLPNSLELPLDLIDS
jgi:hypothetical protein